MLRPGAYRRAPSCLLWVILILGGRSGVAAAQENSAVVVIDSGTEDVFIESLVRTNAETELANQGYRIVTGDEVGGDTPKRLLACAGDLACSIEALKGITAQYAIFISLRSGDKSGSANFKIVIRNYEVATGKALARTMRRCPECKEEVDLAAFTAQLIVDLTKESSEKVDPFVVEPLDKDPVDPVDPVDPPEPVTGPIPVPVTVATPGPTPGPIVQGDAKPSANNTLIYAGMGAGVIAVAAGTYLVLIDGPVIENDVRQRDANDTLVPGFVSLGAGVAAIGLSAWLWASKEKDSSAAYTQAGPSILPSSEGASLVWSGGF